MQSPKEQAQVAKNKGNKYFKGGMFDQAIECYTEAIRICPAEFKQDISTFYQNRAAAYENLVRFGYKVWLTISIVLKEYFLYL